MASVGSVEEKVYVMCDVAVNGDDKLMLTNLTAGAQRKTF